MYYTIRYSLLVYLVPSFTRRHQSLSDTHRVIIPIDLESLTDKGNQMHTSPGRIRRRIPIHTAAAIGRRSKLTSLMAFGRRLPQRPARSSPPVTASSAQFGKEMVVRDADTPNILGHHQVSRKVDYGL
jgi:hypothetical protein